jgi:hypothetical protein
VSALQVSGNTIGGTSTGARNVISGNGLDGISTNGGSNLVQGNYIGISATGDSAVANQRNGVLVGSNTTDTVIGGTTAAARNVISGNAAEGVRMFGDGAAVEGNYIGTDAAGTGALGNGEEGVYISFGGSGNRVGGSAAGAGNLIAFNGGAGVAIEFIDVFDPVTDNVVIRNSTHSNAGLGIDLENDGPTLNDHCDGDDGANGRQNAPEIHSVTPGGGGTTDVRVRLDSAPNQTYTLEFFSTPIESPTAFPEAMTFIGVADVAVGPGCIFDGVVNLPASVPAGHWITATVDGVSELVPPPALSIDDVSQDEGDTGTTDFTFTVSLSAPWHSTLTVDYETADGTASTPADYAAISGTLTFPQGVTSRTITVDVNGDTDVEPDERLFVDLSDFSLGADAIEDARGRGTIDNDDDETGGDPPSLAIDDVSEVEGHSGRTPFVFTVTRSGDLSEVSSVRFRTREGTAVLPEDFVPIRGTLEFEPGQATATITVNVKGDGVDARDDSFTVRLSAPAGAVIERGVGTGTIVNDDPYLVIGDAVITAPDSGRRTVKVPVTLSFRAPPRVRVHFATRDGTAAAGSDYVAQAGELRFERGQRTIWLSITVEANQPGEGRERFFIDLSDVRSGFIFDGTARVTIR